MGSSYMHWVEMVEAVLRDACRGRCHGRMQLGAKPAAGTVTLTAEGGGVGLSADKPGCQVAERVETAGRASKACNRVCLEFEPLSDTKLWSCKDRIVSQLQQGNECMVCVQCTGSHWGCSAGRHDSQLSASLKLAEIATPWERNFTRLHRRPTDACHVDNERQVHVLVPGAAVRARRSVHAVTAC